jgi:hypothetical protein
VDVSPGDDVSHATVAAMSDQTLCAELARLDTEWLRPPHEPDHFDCDDSDFVTGVSFADVPHEVLGTYPMTDAKTKCADIRGVDHWWKSQDRRNKRRTVPQFHTQDDQPSFRTLTREWEGRMRFATEQHSELEMQHEIFDLIATVSNNNVGLTGLMDTDLATQRILALVQRSERDLAIVADVAIAPLVYLLSDRFHWVGIATVAAEALYWIADRGGDARIRQIAQAKAAEPLVAVIMSGIGGPWPVIGRIKHASAVLHELTKHPSTALLVMQAGATRVRVEALQVHDYDHIGVFKTAAYTLANIVRFDATQIVIILEAGAMVPIVQSLDPSHPGAMQSVSSAAFLIAHIATVPHGREAIRVAGGIGALVALLDVLDNMKPVLGVYVTNALAQIAVDSSCRLAMISANAVDALQHAFSRRPDIRANVLNILRHLGFN